ncbi:type II toxin-antitoxin system RelE/ParE family toxin [Phreatobacter sp.]|uniref:type II toxin-antitoxin system RelE/ParE family toxin n=1 Tax=Phreatobacter sp. TaxID=1966341 RepID=UPI0025E3A800|nr:type II toxin-antitoxin system RelE/ParE family toxin [Phreatobacter sp.]
MHGVLATPTFESDAKRAGLTDEELQHIATVIAADPLAGDLIAGTGGARKMRFARPGSGKSGGYRTIHYFGGDDVPVFLLAIYGKGEKANLSKAERNELATILPMIARDYRARRR